MIQLPRYSVIDVETTGGKPGIGRITEIAIFRMEGTEIVDHFTSLVNPEITIPYYISRLTGITNEMVNDAPRFYEIAKRIVELTENTIFVAHNVSFDYHFIQKEFESLGYKFERDQLCTVRLSRKILPGRTSYSLGNLCQELNIPLSDRHRAGGDAHATALLLKYLIEKKGDFVFPPQAFDPSHLHPNFDFNQAKSLPEKTGIYIFLNDNGEVIYVGKSCNIKNRVLSHLRAKSKSKRQMIQQLVDVETIVTGSELIALLMEAEQIQKHKPPFNKALKKNNFAWGIYYYTDRKGYIRFFVERTTKMTSTPVASFSSKSNARKYLAQWVQKNKLCRFLSGLEDNSNGCFDFQLNQCSGACQGIEKPEDYNQRALNLLKQLNLPHHNFVIVDKGRQLQEKSFVWVDKGEVRGYGWINNEVTITSPDMLEDFLVGGIDDRDARIIIRSWLSAQKDHVQLLTY